MNADLKSSLDTFVTLLPDYLPESPVNAHDSGRLIMVAYRSEKINEPVDFDYLFDLLRDKYSDFRNEDIHKFVDTCKSVLDDWKFVIGLLKNKDLLK